MNLENKDLKKLIKTLAKYEDNDCNSILHIGVMNGHKTLVKLLLKYGFNVNITNPFKITPLHAAVYSNNIYMVKLLLKYNANTNAKDDYNRTPLDWTKNYYCDEEIIKLLTPKENQ